MQWIYFITLWLIMIDNVREYICIWWWREGDSSYILYNIYLIAKPCLSLSLHYSYSHYRKLFLLLCFILLQNNIYKIHIYFFRVLFPITSWSWSLIDIIFVVLLFFYCFAFCLCVFLINFFFLLFEMRYYYYYFILLLVCA